MPCQKRRQSYLSLKFWLDQSQSPATRHFSCSANTNPDRVWLSSPDNESKRHRTEAKSLNCWQRWTVGVHWSLGSPAKAALNRGRLEPPETNIDLLYPLRARAAVLCSPDSLLLPSSCAFGDLNLPLTLFTPLLLETSIPFFYQLDCITPCAGTLAYNPLSSPSEQIPTIQTNHPNPISKSNKQNRQNEDQQHPRALLPPGPRVSHSLGQARLGRRDQNRGSHPDR